MGVAMAEFDDLGPSETILRGSWLQEGTAVRADPVCERIAWLIDSRLQQTAVDASGWGRLYRDPRDGRLWELTYPNSEMHGARRLSPLSRTPKRWCGMIWAPANPAGRRTIISVASLPRLLAAERQGR